VARLRDAAARLDQAKPLDLDAAVRDDTTKELKEARASLTELAAYSGMFTHHPIRNSLPGPGWSVLTILDLPECAVELVVNSLADTPPVLNPSELGGSLTVRRLAHALDREADAALVAVARGDYAGVSFSLADPDEQRRRAGNAQRAGTRPKSGTAVAGG
jgi:hypothetical protein